MKTDWKHIVIEILRIIMAILGGLGGGYTATML